MWPLVLQRPCLEKGALADRRRATQGATPVNESVLLIVSMLLAGFVCARLRVMPPDAADAFNAFVIYVCLPATIWKLLPGLRFERELWLLAAVPWALLGVSVLLISLLARLLRWSREVRGALLLCVPLGNTSFLGFPMISALEGESALRYAVLYDQLGSFLALASYGLAVAARFGSGSAPSLGQTLLRVARFPPAIALVLAFSPLPQLPVLRPLLPRLSDLLVPIAMFAVGLRLNLRLPRPRSALVCALGIKLVMMPALVGPIRVGRAAQRDPACDRLGGRHAPHGDRWGGGRGLGARARVGGRARGMRRVVGAADAAGMGSAAALNPTDTCRQRAGCRARSCGRDVPRSWYTGQMRMERWADLNVRIVGGTDREGGGDGPVVVLMHGYGAPGDDLVPLQRVLAVPRDVRFVFPEAPLSPPELRAFGGRAWWPIDVFALQQAAAQGRVRERMQVAPDGLAEARVQVIAMLDELERRLGVASERVVIGGFSQGSMLACDVVLRDSRPFAGLVLLSTTPLCIPQWQPLMAARKGLAVLQTHGVHDPLLPFALAEEERDMLRASGMDVTWVAFPGAHELPSVVLEALSEFLHARLPLRAGPAS